MGEIMSRKEKGKDVGTKLTWGEWLKQQGRGLAQRDDHCRNPNFRPHVWSSHGFAGVPSLFGQGVIFRLPRGKQKAKCQPR